MEDKLLTSGLQSTNKSVKQLSSQEAMAAIFDQYWQGTMIASGDCLDCLIDRKIRSLCAVWAEAPARGGKGGRLPPPMLKKMALAILPNSMRKIGGGVSSYFQM